VLVHEALNPQLLSIMTSAAEDAGAAKLAQITRDIGQLPHDADAGRRDRARCTCEAARVLSPGACVAVCAMEKMFVEGVSKIYDGGVTVGRDGTWIDLRRTAARSRSASASSDERVPALRFRLVVFQRQARGVPALQADPAPSASRSNIEVMRKVILPSTGFMKVPAMQLPDGRWLKDTTPMMQWLDREHPAHPVYPDDPASRFMALLVEDYADEWMWRPAMYYRWQFADSHVLRRHRIGRELAADTAHRPGWSVGISAGGNTWCSCAATACALTIALRSRRSISARCSSCPDCLPIDVSCSAIARASSTSPSSRRCSVTSRSIRIRRRSCSTPHRRYSRGSAACGMRAATAMATAGSMISPIRVGRRVPRDRPGLRALPRAQRRVLCAQREALDSSRRRLVSTHAGRALSRRLPRRTAESLARARRSRSSARARAAEPLAIRNGWIPREPSTPASIANSNCRSSSTTVPRAAGTACACIKARRGPSFRSTE